VSAHEAGHVLESAVTKEEDETIPKRQRAKENLQ
jgi:hypothetical protein